MYGCGIGPISRERNKRRASKCLNRYVDAITLREDGSLETLASLGVTKPEVTLAADPALTLDRSDDALTESAMIGSGIDPKGEYFCLALRKWKNWESKREIFARAADYAAEKYGLGTVFLPIERRDAEAAKEVASMMRHASFALAPQSSARVVIGVLSRMKAVLSMRLHGLIFAAGQGVPVVGVAYDPKVSSFLKYMGIELCIDIEDLTEDKLLGLIDSAMSGGANGDPERLREIERGNVEVAARLLSPKTGGKK